jgi:hypothetical protein
LFPIVWIYNRRKSWKLLLVGERKLPKKGMVVSEISQITGLALEVV